jgi:hypothetical protein
MTSEKLKQANRPFDDSQLQSGMKICFYRPPSQLEVSTKGRKAKHLAHYHGPATVTAIPRRRQLELQYEGKSFNCDISLGIPAKDFGNLDELDTIEDETEGSSLAHNLFTSSREILCSCVACSRDYIVAQRMPTKRTTVTS